LLALPNLQARLRAELRNWKLKRLNFARSLGTPVLSSIPKHRALLLRYTLKEAWDHFSGRTVERRNLLVDDLQNITGIGKSELALTSEISSSRSVLRA